MLKTEGRVHCAALAAHFQVSEHTIRRDLQELAAAGLCRRVHGGAVSALRAPPDFDVRLGADEEAKARLARACAKLLRPNACVFIDAGTTNLAITRAIAPDLALTVVTHTPAIAVEAMKHPGVEVIMLGGRVRPHSGASLGITPLKQLEGMHFDQCLLGACALDGEEGVTAFDYDDAEFKQILVGRSSEVIVAVTEHKVPGVSRYRVCSVEQISTLILESSMPEEKVAPFVEKGVRIELA